MVREKIHMKKMDFILYFLKNYKYKDTPLKMNFLTLQGLFSSLDQKPETEGNFLRVPYYENYIRDGIQFTQVWAYFEDQPYCPFQILVISYEDTLQVEFEYLSKRKIFFIPKTLYIDRSQHKDLFDQLLDLEKEEFLPLILDFQPFKKDIDAFFEEMIGEPKKELVFQQIQWFFHK